MTGSDLGLYPNITPAQARVEGRANPQGECPYLGPLRDAWQEGVLSAIGDLLGTITRVVIREHR